MANNPFMSTVQSIRRDYKSQTSAAYRIGTVTSVIPLSVDVAGTSQNSSELLKNDMLYDLELGDRLLLLPIEDEQRYIILCRVVNV
jgi:uncharacterized protein involved in copper resistance